MATSRKTPEHDPDSTDPLAGLLDNEFVKSLRGSAQQVWLAGLGALSKAQAEGGKVFEQLVEEGQTLHKRTQAAAGDKFSDVGAKVSGVAGDVGAKAAQSWDKFESIFEDRTSKALTRLGVPSAKQVSALEARVDALSAELARLSQRVSEKPATTTRSSARPASAKNAGKASAKTAAKSAAKATKASPQSPARPKAAVRKRAG